MKMYDYLIAYKFDMDGYLSTCSGTIHLSRKNKIKTFEDINDVIKFITDNIDGAKNVSIYNFILLGRNRH